MLTDVITALQKVNMIENLIPVAKCYSYISNQNALGKTHTYTTSA